MRLLFLLLFSFVATCVHSSNIYKPQHLIDIEENLFRLNNEEKYDSSLLLINQVIQNPKSTNLDLCFAHIYMSHLNKRLFSYEKIIKDLRTALKYADISSEVDFARTNVIAEIAFYYFDKSYLNESEKLVLEVIPMADKYLDKTTQAYLLIIIGMQQFYESAEIESSLNFLERAEKLLEMSAPCHLPLVYLKQIKVYTSIQDTTQFKRLKSQTEKAIDSCGIYKYKILFVKELKEASEKLNDLESYIKYDALYNNFDSSYSAQSRAIELEYISSELNKERLKKTKNKEKYYKLVLAVCIGFIIILTYFVIRLYRFTKKKDK